jgi:D-amino-acid dehydrogenase
VQILRWLGKEDAPLLFRLRADARQWQWVLRFLAECRATRARRNTRECLAIALYSRDCLRALRAATGIEYDHLERGILELHTDATAYAHAVAKDELLEEYGARREVKTADECVAIEPARRAAARGLVFRGRTAIEAIAVEGGAVRGVRCVNENGGAEVLAADAYVVALGSYSPLLLRPIGVPALVYPLKGYSATIDVGQHRGAPTVSLGDVASKIVISRLGGRLRVAGTAELDRYGTELNAVRCEALVRRTFELFPDAGERCSARFWAGLRPATPSNVPLVGRTRYPNLFLDTGHGTLGWTMACGSGRALADLIAGREPEVDFAFTAAS